MRWGQERRAHAPARDAGPIVAGFIDASPYLESVCDHAAWCASQVGGSVRLVFSQDSNPSGSANDNCAHSARRLLQRGLARLADNGALEAEADAFSETLVEVSRSSVRGAELLIVGRDRSADGRVSEGLCQLIQASTTPVLITPKFFLPVTTAMTVGLPSPWAEPYSTAVRTSPWLSGLRLLRGDPQPATAQAASCDLVVLPRLAFTFQASAPLALSAREHLNSRRPVLVL